MSELERRLKSGDFGSDSESVFYFCKQIAELDKATTRCEQKKLLKKCQVSKRKWVQLCRVGCDYRLDKYTKSLPDALTSIFALTTLTDEELNDGMVSGDINSSTSSRKIYSYARQQRLKGKAFLGVQKILPCYLAIDEDASSKDFIGCDKLVERVNNFLSNHGVMLIMSASTTSRYLQKQKDLIVKEHRQGAIETQVEHEMYLAGVHLKENYSLEDIDRILEGSMNEFVRALLSISKSRIDMMKTYGKLYCYKIALEYHRAESRVQRFNYKRRLIHVQHKYKFLAPVVDGIFDELMERPRT